jgi:hypothetical protein
MNAGEGLARIERQLRREADQLLGLLGQPPPTARLLAEHHRRRRRRLVRCACGIAAVLILATILVSTGGVPRSPRQAQPLVNPHEPGKRPAPVVQGREPGADASEQGVPSDLRPHVPPADSAPHVAAHPATGANRPTAWPVVITVPEGDKQRVIAAGIYVPEHTRPLNLSELTPGEQHAVREVLGIPQESISHDPL